MLDHDPQTQILVGREQERRLLDRVLSALEAGRGRPVLISGGAGIGKTALVRDLTRVAERQGHLVLTGHCYDLSAVRPYDPWRAIIDACLRLDEVPKPITILHGPAGFAEAASPTALFDAVTTYLRSVAESQPLVLVLEDLHWADPGSIELLRSFAREIANLQVLLLVTYREDDLTPDHPLYLALPHLVRETDAWRIKLPPLDLPAIQALVEGRYALPAVHQRQLVKYLEVRGEGLPLYLMELLRTLEDERRLIRGNDGWVLIDLDHVQVPALIRQVIGGRLARLAPEVRELLQTAAVIGRELSPELWRRLSGLSRETFAAYVDQAIQAQLLYAEPATGILRFSHTLIRETLYAGIPPLHRQNLHRLVAETLSDEGHAEPELVAFHFQQALDPRAAEWFIRAGNRVERVAWLTAASHFESALRLMRAINAPAGERGWLLARRASLLRNANPSVALTILDEASLVALDSGDPVLMGYVKHLRGLIRCLAGEMRVGMADLRASLSDLARLTPDDVQRMNALVERGTIPSRSEFEGLYACELAMVGRIEEARSRGQAIVESGERISARTWWTLATALALSGRPEDAREAIESGNDVLRAGSDHPSLVVSLMIQLFFVQMPYYTDDLTERERIAGDGVMALEQSRGAHGDVAPRIARLPLLQIEGAWQEANELAEAGIWSRGDSSVKRLISTVVLTQQAQARGKPAVAWDLVQEMLPDGPLTVPGHTNLVVSLVLMRVAVLLCLERDDIEAARGWLEAHDRWLRWSGAIHGQADGHLHWAYYYDARGQASRAHGRARRALELASDPRQPLTLLASHRMLGRLETEAGDTQLRLTTFNGQSTWLKRARRRSNARLRSQHSLVSISPRETQAWQGRHLTSRKRSVLRSMRRPNCDGSSV